MLRLRVYYLMLMLSHMNFFFTCGAFNTDFLNHADKSAQSLMNIMHSYHMLPIHRSTDTSN